MYRSIVAWANEDSLRGIIIDLLKLIFHNLMESILPETGAEEIKMDIIG